MIHTSLMQDWQHYDYSGQNVLQIVTIIILYFAEMHILTEGLMLFIDLFVPAFPWQDFGVGCFVGTFATESVSSLSGPS